MKAFETTRDFASQLDADDPVAACRQRFHLPRMANGEPCIYFCGNSLGLQPKTVREAVEQVLTDWQTLGVDGHFTAKPPWLSYHELVCAPLARLVGAQPLEVVAMNTLTVNLHLMLVSFYRPTPTRHKILIESRAFPSDQYAVASQLRFHGFDPSEALIEAQPRASEAYLRTEDLIATIEQLGESLALILLGGVNYYSGQAFDLAAITRAGHDQGSVVGFDLAHAAGNLMLQLHDWQVDFAVWCSYKYLNAGPGGIAGCFVHDKHARRSDLPRFAGWWGHNKSTRFAMPPEFEPLPGAEGWQISNSPILSLAALRAALEMFDEAGMPSLRAKSERLTGYLEYLLGLLPDERFEIITPRDPQQRGAQLSIRVHPNGKRVHEHLIQAGVVCDWREPDVIRVAPVPLYNTFEEVFRFVEIFGRAVKAV